MLQSQIAVASCFLSSAGLWFLSRTMPLELLLPYLAGAATLLLALICMRKQFSPSQRIDRITVFGPMFLAVPMAIFGADHFVFAHQIVPLVPSWIPGHLFWVVFVGIALLAGGLSLAIQKFAHLAAALFGTMLFLFAVLMDIPALVGNPGNRFAWAYLFRDLAFGAGALTFAATQISLPWTRSAHAALIWARTVIGIAAIFFATEHFLHPEFRPGVPLEHITPSWIPLRAPVSYLTGAVLLVTGAALLLNKRTKLAATALGLWQFLLVIVVYVPITAAEPLAIDNGLNYLGDTLMFSGSLLCLAGSCRTGTSKEKATGLAFSTTAGDLNH